MTDSELQLLQDKLDQVLVNTTINKTALELLTEEFFNFCDSYNKSEGNEQKINHYKKLQSQLAKSLFILNDEVYNPSIPIKASFELRKQISYKLQEFIEK